MSPGRADAKAASKPGVSLIERGPGADTVRKSSERAEFAMRLTADGVCSRDARHAPRNPPPSTTTNPMAVATRAMNTPSGALRQSGEGTA